MRHLFQAVSLALTLVSYGGLPATAQLLPDTAPEQSQPGQIGTNKCGKGHNQTSLCQNSFINSVQDFCLYGPPQPGPDSVIGNTERIEVAWCIKDGYGTRLIPDGSITGAHFVVTPDFVQVTGTGNLTGLNIPAGDTGGELDPHGADGNGNPIGGLVFSSGFGDLQQILEWTNFMSADQFCFRACKPGPMAATWCQHIYDVMGCAWNMPANYNAGVFEQCRGDSGQPMGVYGGSTFHQGEPATPPPHPVPSSSSCTTLTSIGNSLVGATSKATATSSATKNNAQASGSTSGGAARQTASSASQLTITGTSLLAIGLLGAVFTCF